MTFTDREIDILLAAVITAIDSGDFDGETAEYKSLRRRLAEESLRRHYMTLSPKEKGEIHKLVMSAFKIGKKPKRK